MKTTKLLVLTFISSIILTGCGYAYKDAYKADKYVSSNYLENYYDVWDEKIDKQSENCLISSTTERAVTNEDNLFLSYNSDNFLNVERDRDSLYFDSMHEDEETFGKQRRLSNYDSSFKYGIISKLFDGRTFCEGHYERARVQVMPQNKEIEGYNYRSGFGYLFEKECQTASYFAVSFRCATNPKPTNTTNCLSDIDFFVSFYLNDLKGGYTKNTYSINVPDATTNNGGNYNNKGYTFLGFELGKNIDISLCAGFSIEYKVNDTYVMEGDTKKSVDQTCAHSLMLYEVFLPNSIWH